MKATSSINTKKQSTEEQKLKNQVVKSLNNTSLNSSKSKNVSTRYRNSYRDAYQDKLNYNSEEHFINSSRNSIRNSLNNTNLSMDKGLDFSSSQIKYDKNDNFAKPVTSQSTKNTGIKSNKFSNKEIPKKTTNKFIKKKNIINNTTNPDKVLNLKDTSLSPLENTNDANSRYQTISPAQSSGGLKFEDLAKSHDTDNLKEKTPIVSRDSQVSSPIRLDLPSSSRLPKNDVLTTSQSSATNVNVLIKSAMESERAKLLQMVSKSYVEITNENIKITPINKPSPKKSPKRNSTSDSLTLTPKKSISKASSRNSAPNVAIPKKSIAIVKPQRNSTSNSISSSSGFTTYKEAKKNFLNKNAQSAKNTVRSILDNLDRNKAASSIQNMKENEADKNKDSNANITNTINLGKTNSIIENGDNQNVDDSSNTDNLRAITPPNINIPKMCNSPIRGNNNAYEINLCEDSDANIDQQKNQGDNSYEFKITMHDNSDANSENIAFDGQNSSVNLMKVERQDLSQIDEVLSNATSRDVNCYRDSIKTSHGNGIFSSVVQPSNNFMITGGFGLKEREKDVSLTEKTLCNLSLNLENSISISGKAKSNYNNNSNLYMNKSVVLTIDPAYGKTRTHFNQEVFAESSLQINIPNQNASRKSTNLKKSNECNVEITKEEKKEKEIKLVFDKDKVPFIRTSQEAVEFIKRIRNKSPLKTSSKVNNFEIKKKKLLKSPLKLSKQLSMEIAKKEKPNQQQNFKISKMNISIKVNKKKKSVKLLFRKSKSLEKTDISKLFLLSGEFKTKPQKSILKTKQEEPSDSAKKTQITKNKIVISPERLASIAVLKEKLIRPANSSAEAVLANLNFDKSINSILNKIRSNREVVAESPLETQSRDFNDSFTKKSETRFYPSENKMTLGNVGNIGNSNPYKRVVNKKNISPSISVSKSKSPDDSKLNQNPSIIINTNNIIPKVYPKSKLDILRDNLDQLDSSYHIPCDDRFRIKADSVKIRLLDNDGGDDRITLSKNEKRGNYMFDISPREYDQDLSSLIITDEALIEFKEKYFGKLEFIDRDKLIRFYKKYMQKEMKNRTKFSPPTLQKRKLNNEIRMKQEEIENQRNIQRIRDIVNYKDQLKKPNQGIQTPMFEVNNQIKRKMPVPGDLISRIMPSNDIEPNQIKIMGYFPAKYY